MALFGALARAWGWRVDGGPLQCSKLASTSGGSAAPDNWQSHGALASQASGLGAAASGGSSRACHEQFISRDPVESAGSDWTPTFDYSHTGENGVQRNFMIGYYRKSAKRYNADEEETAVEVLQRIEEAQRNDQSVDADILMRGADVCHDLCGQRLLTLMTAMLYEGDRMPSETHRAIAILARSQFVPESGELLYGLGRHHHIQLR
jgi:hypothetical protein